MKVGMMTDRILNLAGSALAVSVFASLAILVNGEAHGAAVAPSATAPAVASQDVRGPRTPCVSDEGPEGQPILPCVWDALHRGNHSGHSFIMRRDGSVVRISHARAHALTFGASS